jgi:glycosyltransferase involved in cell wall biosynthesis
LSLPALENQRIQAESTPVHSYSYYFQQAKRGVELRFSNSYTIHKLPPFVKQFFNGGLWYIAAMRLLFVADGRSPTALSWLRHWIETGHHTHLVSSFPCNPPPGLASFHILPAAFSGMARGMSNNMVGSTHTSGIVGRFRSLLRPLRYVLGPLSLPFHQTRFHKLVEEIRPDLVHALRIPFEGMLASVTPAGYPLVVSIWGNDLTLHARGSILMASLTRRTLRRAVGLIADTERDIRLGHEWGFAPNKPTLVVPGAGGVRLDEIETASNFGKLPEELPDVPIVVNPRGQRPGSLRQDAFFQSIPLVLEKIPQTLFICPPLAGDVESEHWVASLGIRSNTKLWPHLDRSQMWLLFKKARVFVSPSVHDGTPNSLLEAMACGCFPVVGNIESMQEWVTPGVNGLLVDAASPRALANGIITALESPALCAAAKNQNARIIAERATNQRCMAITEAFYQKFNWGNFKVDS